MRGLGLLVMAVLLAAGDVRAWEPERSMTIGMFKGPGSTAAAGYQAADCGLRYEALCGRWDATNGDSLTIDGFGMKVAEGGADCRLMLEKRVSGAAGVLGAFACPGPDGVSVQMAAVRDLDMLQPVRTLRLYHVATPGLNPLDQLLCLVSQPGWGDGSRPLREAACDTAWVDLAQPRDLRGPEQRIAEDILPRCDLKNVEFCGWWSRGGREGGGNPTIYGSEWMYDWGGQSNCEVLREERSDDWMYSVFRCTDPHGPHPLSSGPELSVLLHRSSSKDHGWDLMRQYYLSEDEGRPWDDQIQCLLNDPDEGHGPVYQDASRCALSYSSFARPELVTPRGP